MEEAKEASGSDNVAIVAHSAGGWMTRVWMLERKSARAAASAWGELACAVYSWLPSFVHCSLGARLQLLLSCLCLAPSPRTEIDDISLVLTLGSPLRPPPNLPGVIDQTRGILKYVDEFCPGPKDIQQAVRHQRRGADAHLWIWSQGRSPRASRSLCLL